MRNRKRKNEALIRLYQCAVEDVRDRLCILLLEVRHLQKFAAFELSDTEIMKSLANEKNPVKSEKQELLKASKEVLEKIGLGSEEKSSQFGFHKRLLTPSKRMMAFLAESGQMIKADIYRSLAYVHDMRKSLEEMNRDQDVALEKSNDKCLEKEVRNKKKFFILSQTIQRARIEVFVKRIGDIRKRLAQEMDHLNPELQSPTIRRRQEYGFIDNYLKDLTFWAHRDLAILSKKLGAGYPGSNVPLTLQYWGFDYTSRNSAYRPDACHQNWKGWFYNRKKTGGKPVDNRINKYTAFIQTSYWMLDMPEYHPIIGHEVAHRVLRDSLGRLELSTLQHRKDKLSRLARMLVPLIDSYSEACSISFEPALPLVEEILCDCMAASRFGCAYLYARPLHHERFLIFP